MFYDVWVCHFLFILPSSTLSADVLMITLSSNFRNDHHSWMFTTNETYLEKIILSLFNEEFFKINKSVVVLSFVFLWIRAPSTNRHRRLLFGNSNQKYRKDKCQVQSSPSRSFLLHVSIIIESNGRGYLMMRIWSSWNLSRDNHFPNHNSHVSIHCSPRTYNTNRHLLASMSV